MTCPANKEECPCPEYSKEGLCDYPFKNMTEQEIKEERKLDYSKLVMVGAAQDDKGLKDAKKWLDDVKRWKLRIKADKHRSNTYTFSSLMYHLNEELREFRQAVRKQKHPTTVLTELADVSNMVDMIASTIMTNEDRD